MISALLDTQALIWLLVGSPRLSESARLAIDTIRQAGDSLGIATMSLVELHFLIERGRIAESMLATTMALINSQTESLTAFPLTTEVAATLGLIPREQIPEMPDRIIAATAFHYGLPLITSDSAIRSSIVPTIW